MDLKDVKELDLGIYKIKWENCNGYSIASVGMLSNGDKWLAPTNWVEPSLKPEIWEGVESAELICTQHSLSEEEPVKIQTEYEHNLERYKLLFGSGLSHHHDETVKLAGWIANNQPEKWEFVTRENIKVGDSVKNNETGEILKVGFIYRQQNTFVLQYQDKETDIASDFCFYEINTYIDTV